PRQAETGAWFVAYLQIVDKADNSLVAQFTKTTIPQGGSLSVYSRDSDSAPPDVRRVWLDKSTVSGGQKNLVIVDIQDDRSGVASVTGKFQSPTGSALLEFSCHG